MAETITKIKECSLRKALICERGDSAVEIAKKLRDSKERHIVVVDSGKPVGLISTTDINNRLVAEGKDPKKTKAQDIMTASMFIKDINESLTKTYIEMLNSNIYSCPVTENGKLKGVLDLGEAMNHLAKKIKTDKG